MPNPYANPYTSTAHREADGRAAYRVTVTRPTPDGPVVEKHEHHGVNSLNWDDRYLRLHPHADEGALPLAMYAHAAVLDLQVIDDDLEDKLALMGTRLTPRTLRAVADYLEGTGCIDADLHAVAYRAGKVNDEGEQAPAADWCPGGDWTAIVVRHNGETTKHYPIASLGTDDVGEPADIVLLYADGLIAGSYRPAEVDRIELVGPRVGETRTVRPSFDDEGRGCRLVEDAR